VKVILVEPYFDMKTPNSIASATGARVVELLPSVCGERGACDYFTLFDYDLGKLSQAFQGQ
jgi:ABC-type Zn uptake system ZnuABC Zn-binding protein ZnuA